MKRCGRCKETKDDSDFRKYRGAKDGLQGYCKPCHSATVKAAPSQTSEARKKRAAQRTDDQLLRDQAAQRIRYARWKAKKIATDPEGLRRAEAEKAAKWREQHPDRNAEVLRRYRQSNPGKRRTEELEYRARKMAASIGTVDLTEIIKRDGDICHICGIAVDPNAETYAPLARTFDHVIPLISGGAHSMDNVKVAHRLCNVRKDCQTRRQEEG